MKEEFKENAEIEFNDNYDRGLMQTPIARILMSHVEQTYPRVYKNMRRGCMVESYVEPKIMKLIDLEHDYRKQGYPNSGVEELALNDVLPLIKMELQPYEDAEYLEEFDLDINPIIDTEEI